MADRTARHDSHKSTAGNRQRNPVVAQRPAPPVDMPGDIARRETFNAVRRVQYKPQEILADPEQHDAGEHTRLGTPAPVPAKSQRKMEEQRHARKQPGVIAGHGSAAPENIEQPVMLDAPGRQIRRPTRRAFDLDLGRGQRRTPAAQSSRASATAPAGAWKPSATLLPSPKGSSVQLTHACHAPSRASIAAGRWSCELSLHDLEHALAPPARLPQATGTSSRIRSRAVPASASNWRTRYSSEIRSIAS